MTKRKKIKRPKPWHFVKAIIQKDGRAELITSDGEEYHVEIDPREGDAIVSRRMRWQEMHQRRRAREKKEKENTPPDPLPPRPTGNEPFIRRVK